MFPELWLSCVFPSVIVEACCYKLDVLLEHVVTMWMSHRGAVYDTLRYKNLIYRFRGVMEGLRYHGYRAWMMLPAILTITLTMGVA